MLNVEFSCTHQVNIQHSTLNIKIKKNANLNNNKVDEDTSEKEISEETAIKGEQKYGIS